MTKAPIKFQKSEDGFLGLSGKDAFTPQQADAWIIPFGLEASVSYGTGTSKGPEAIIKASHQVELFDEVFWSEAFRDYGVATMKPIPHSGELEDDLDVLEAAVEDALSHNKFPFVLGGEHSLTAGAIRPFAAAHDQLTILQFDAHADLRNGYDGIHYSHAAAMRRCLDHENIRLVSVGIRNVSVEEIPYIEENKDRIEIFWAKDKSEWSSQKIAEAVGSGLLYVTFDLDGFDSSLMPATGTPEPGGLFWAETMEILDAVSKQATIVGADVVELAPREELHACDFLAAKLTYKILNYALAQQ